MSALEKITEWTNENGEKKDGASWRKVDFVGMAKFQCVLLRMGHVRRNKMKDYFEKRTGDPVVRSLKMSFKQFAAVYRRIRMFSESAAAVSGASDASNSASYDGLFGVRPGWNLFMSAFQKARTPGELTSTDEGMIPFDVRVIFGTSMWYSVTLTSTYVHVTGIMGGRNRNVT